MHGASRWDVVAQMADGRSIVLDRFENMSDATTAKVVVENEGFVTDDGQEYGPSDISYVDVRPQNLKIWRK